MRIAADAVSRRRVLALLGASAAVAGCASGPAPEEGVKTNVIEANYKAADALLEGVQLDRRLPVLVATFVNLEELTESSRLGRLFSEQVGGRIAQRGYPVKELKLRDNLFMKQSQGALLLSRELRDISQSHQAQAVVVGTYTSSGKMIYLSIKLVVPEGNLVLAAHDYGLPIDANIKGLLK